MSEQLVTSKKGRPRRTSNGASFTTCIWRYTFIGPRRIGRFSTSPIVRDLVVLVDFIFMALSGLMGK